VHLLRHGVTPVGHASTLTSEYTATHVTLTAVARELGLSRTQVRVLVALAERNRQARSDKLEQDLALDSSAVRRSLPVLYDRGLCAGSPRKRGTRTTVTLTDAGQAIADKVHKHRSSLLEPKLKAARAGKRRGGERKAASVAEDFAQTGRLRVLEIPIERRLESEPQRPADSDSVPGGAA
jgi:DNA-binding MarR family transcriptional regulator